MIEPVDLQDQCARLLTEIEELVDYARGNDLPADELATLLHWFRTLKNRCRDADTSLTNTLALMMGRNVEVYGDLLVEKRGGYGRTWNHGALLYHLIRDASVSGDGEVWPLTDEVFEVLRDCAAISYWRIGKLKEHGVNPDLFCEKSEEVKFTVTIRGPEDLQ